MTDKSCSKCKTLKPLAEFYGRKNSPDGRRTDCKRCRDAVKRAYRRMGVSTRPEPPACECCGRQKSRNRALNQDHDHATGAFRGWLCTRCNIGLGTLGDTLEGLQRARDYLHQAWLLQ